MPDFVKVCLIYEFLPQAYGFSFQLGDTGIQNFLWFLIWMQVQQIL